MGSPSGERGHSRAMRSSFRKPVEHASFCSGTPPMKNRRISNDLLKQDSHAIVRSGWERELTNLLTVSQAATGSQRARRSLPGAESQIKLLTALHGSARTGQQVPLR